METREDSLSRMSRKCSKSLYRRRTEEDLSLKAGIFVLFKCQSLLSKIEIEKGNLPCRQFRSLYTFSVRLLKTKVSQTFDPSHGVEDTYHVFVGSGPERIQIRQRS